MDTPTPPTSTKKKWALVPALLVIAAVLGGVIWLVIANQKVDPAQYLHPEETVAVFTHAERNEWKTYAKLFPVLSLVPAITAEDSTLAILKSGNVFGWLLIGKAPLTAGADKATVLSPSVEALSSFTDWTPPAKEEATLQTFAPFQTLSAAVPGGSAYAYIHMKDVQTEVTSAFDTLLVKIANSAAAAVVWNDAERTHVVLLAAEEVPETLSAPAGSTWARSRGDSVVSIGEPVRLWSDFLHLLSPSEQILLQGRMTALVHDTFGDDVSLTYDVLPLLEKGVTVTVSESGMVLETSVDGKKNEERVQRIIASVLKSLPRSEITRRTFERGTSVILSANETALQQKKETIAGWDVLTLWNAREKRGMAIAREGQRIKFATNPDLLGLVASGTGSTAVESLLPGIPESTIYGAVTAKGVTSVLKTLLGIPLQSALIPGFSRLRIAVHTNGTLIHLFLERLP